MRPNERVEPLECMSEMRIPAKFCSETLEEMSTHARHRHSGGNIESDVNEIGDLWLRIRLRGGGALNHGISSYKCINGAEYLV